LNRTVEYNERIHIIKKIENKLYCDCGNDIFVGIPCYHIIAIFVKKEISFHLLKFNNRWELSFYKEETNLIDPPNISDIDEVENNEENQEQQIQVISFYVNQ